MSIKIFHIPFKYKGSTENLLRTAIGNVEGHDYSGILYIAPTPGKIKDSRRRFHKLTGGSYVPPEMMTIEQLSKKLYSIHGEKKIIPRSLVPIVISRLSEKGIGFASITANFINELKQHHTGKDPETVGNEIEQILHELGIPEEVAARTMEALRIFKEYQEILNKNSAVDENDVLAACAGLIKKHVYSHDVIIIDGFYELTGPEEKIIRSLIENAEEILISIPYDTNYSSITDSYANFIKGYFQPEEIYFPHAHEPVEPFYYSYPGIEEEIEGIARNIKNCFISGKTRNLEAIVVSFPAFYKYEDLAARIFRRYGIPHSIPASRPAGKTRPFLDLLALLESVIEDYPRLSFAQFLRSPYFRNVPPVLKEWIPNICLSSGIIKGKDAWLNLFKPEIRNRGKKSGIEKGGKLPGLQKELRWVFKKLALLESIRDRGSYVQFAEAAIKVLNNLDFHDPVKETDIKDQVIEILKELCFIDNLSQSRGPDRTGIRNDIPGASHVPPLTLRQFTDALKHVLYSTVTEVEGTGVQIVDFRELRGIEPEYLYFGGLKDGDLPSKPDIDHLLPDSVRTRLGLVNMKKYLLLQRFTFQGAVESAENIHLSYPVAEGDKFSLPSPFLPWNREIKRRVCGIFSKEEELSRKGRIPFTSYMKEIEGMAQKPAKDKFGENSYIRVTDIDSYRACPRKFFIEKVLGLEPLEIKEYEVEAALLGTIAHQIMQVLISKPFENLDDLRVKAEETMEKILSDKPVEDYWRKVIKDTFITILPDIYSLETRIVEEGYSFMDAEVSVKGEILEGIKLKGKIDRVDRKVQSSEFNVQGSRDNKLVSKVVELVDYKTGVTQFSGPQVLAKGATLQLFLYAALMKALGFEVERVGIYSLKDINLSWIPGKNDRKSGRTIEDYIEASLRFLQETVSNMRKGDFSASPLNEQTCRNCPERPYCPYIQKTMSYGKVS